jgi:hypothetical protein
VEAFLQTLASPGIGEESEVVTVRRADQIVSGAAINLFVYWLFLEIGF